MLQIESALRLALENQMVQGMGTAAIVGGFFYHAKDFTNKIKSLIDRYTTVSMTVTSGEQAFIWIDRFLSNLPSAQRSRTVSMKSYENFDDSDSESVSWNLSMGPGNHLIWFNRNPIWVNRDLETKAGSNKPIEKITLKFFGFSQKRLRDFAERAYQNAAKVEYARIFTWNGYWSTLSGKRPRSIESITLKEGQIERIIEDLIWFTGAHQWYADRGIPYRRGYIFDGPPGTGKTSIVLALGGHLNRPICVLNLSTLSSDSSLQEAIMRAPTNAIILLEDIDCTKAATSRDSKSEAEEGPTGITQGSLLNALDGILTPDGRIIIMTTNYKDRLDAALIRPGRADVHETFDLLGSKEQIKFAAKFYSESFEPLSMSISPANLQSAFMRFPDNIKEARTWLESTQSPSPSSNPQT